MKREGRAARACRKLNKVESIVVGVLGANESIAAKNHRDISRSCKEYGLLESNACSLPNATKHKNAERGPGRGKGAGSGPHPIRGTPKARFYETRTKKSQQTNKQTNRRNLTKVLTTRHANGKEVGSQVV